MSSSNSSDLIHGMKVNNHDGWLGPRILECPMTFLKISNYEKYFKINSKLKLRRVFNFFISHFFSRAEIHGFPGPAIYVLVQLLSSSGSVRGSITIIELVCSVACLVVER